MDTAKSTAKGRLAAMETDEHTQYLTFNLNSEVYALGILAVKEIIEYGELTEVPTMPECIRGVINLRGAVVPVMDLAIRFGKTPKPVTKRTCIVIVETEQAGEREDVGVVVDSVNAVTEIADADVEPAPAFGTNVSTEFIRGLGKVDTKFVILLNSERVFSLHGVPTMDTRAEVTQVAA
jgi:purine-binding chemotaxis protein CheW